MSQLILAIDTALNACSVAIVLGQQTLVSRIEPMARGQAERLAPLVAELMSDLDLNFTQIDRIGVTRGPGAFTGLRVGLAFTRGLALALDRPCIGVSTLEVLAAGASQPKTLAAISVAGSVFIGAWAGSTQVISPCRTENLDNLLADLHGDWAVTGPGLETVIAQRPSWRAVIQSQPDPRILAHLARQADPATHAPVPLYLRGVEAKLAGGIVFPQDQT